MTSSQKTEKENVSRGDNQGHIIIQLTKPCKHNVVVRKGERYGCKGKVGSRKVY